MKHVTSSAQCMHAPSTKLSILLSFTVVSFNSLIIHWGLAPLITRAVHLSIEQRLPPHSGGSSRVFILFIMELIGSSWDTLIPDDYLEDIADFWAEASAEDLHPSPLQSLDDWVNPCPAIAGFKWFALIHFWEFPSLIYKWLSSANPI